MPRKNPPHGDDRDLNLSNLSLLFVSEDAARAFLESKRWPGGKPVCPHCWGEGYALTPKPGSKRPGRPGLKKCKACRKQFTVRVGTIFEESKIPLCKWLAAIHLMCSSKKGISSHQIARELGITVKSAWFLTHRIREAMRSQPMAGMLKGTVEVDESYVGARKPRYRSKNNKGGRGTAKKPIVVLVERGGQAVSHPIAGVDATSLKTAIRKVVDPSATIVTDEWSAYRGIGKEFQGGHHTVNHGHREYVRYSKGGKGPVYVSTNEAESYFALFKRGFIGAFHQLSHHHLNRYVDEFAFRWCHRKVTDGERMVKAIQGAEGKRLKYR
jgi:transposase-like protein